MSPVSFFKQKRAIFEVSNHKPQIDLGKMIFFSFVGERLVKSMIAWIFNEIEKH